MSNTIIQVRRSTTNTYPSALQAGELAFTSNGDTLWIGSPSGSNTANVVHIGAKISYIGNSTQIGATAGGSNSELASTYAIKEFVDGKLNAFSTTLDGLDDVTITSIANNNLLVYDYGASKWENHTISGTANEVDVTFSNNDITVGLPDNVTISANLSVTNGLSVNSVSVTSNTLSTNTSTGALRVTGGVGITEKLNVKEVAIGNTTVYASINSVSLSIANVFATDTVNAAVLSVGGSVIANNSGLFTSGIVNADVITVGTGTAFRANSTQVTVSVPSSFTGNTNLTGTANVSVAINVGANVNLSTSFISVGNSTINTNITAGNLALNGSTLTVGNTTTNTTITSGNITTTGTANVATAINVGANVNLTTSSFTVGNSTVNSYITSTSAAFDGTLAAGNTTITGTLASGNTTITGDLTVTGTVTTVDATNLVVEDSLIRLARNQANTASFVDAVDIGFYGVYGNTSQIVYTGLARDSSANVFVLFDGLVNDAPDNVVNTTAITVSKLQAFLISGALSTNSTAVIITANSTVNVGITANTLTLSTSLGVASGGTGRNSLTNNAVVVGNNAGQVTLVSSSTEGHVLQINASGAPTFGVLDGGAF